MTIAYAIIGLISGYASGLQIDLSKPFSSEKECQQEIVYIVKSPHVRPKIMLSCRLGDRNHIELDGVFTESSFIGDTFLLGSGSVFVFDSFDYAKIATRKSQTKEPKLMDCHLEGDRTEQDP